MYIRKTIAGLTASAMLAAMAACSGNHGWKVSGTVEGGADSTIYIEGSTQGGWFVMDSVTVGSNGSFTWQAQEAAEIPSVYRLRMADRYIYFPVDSVEEVTVTARVPAFDRGYTLSGNAAAPLFATVDSLVNNAIDKSGAAGALADADLKKSLNLIINRDTTCLVSYYIVGKFIDNTPLYNVTNKNDLRFIGNAANTYKTRRPADPRAAELEQRWLAGRRATGAVTGTSMEATVADRPVVDLKRYDANGTQHDFDKVVTRGKPTVLSFTRYTSDASPALTAALRKVYDAYSNAGLEIYQVSFDANEIDWKRSAANMPWISVWNSPADGVEVLLSYNADPVNGAPVCFVFNRNGELVERVSDPDSLMGAVAKVM